MQDNVDMKLIYSILIVCAIVVALVILIKPSASTPVTKNPIGVAPSEETLCFTRKQVATPDAPYALEEHIRLTLSGMIATGTKTGTQSGPDMTNGYEGILTGTRNGPSLNLIFAYTIEGSQNSEQEMYILGDSSLIKYRYPLKEEGGILVPDLSGQKTDIAYTLADCE